MELVADESIDAPIIERLRADGHVVWSVAENRPTISDLEVLQIATAQQCVLLTDDNDFGELVFRFGLPAPYGVTRIKLANTLPIARRAEIVAQALATHGLQLIGHLAVIEEDRVRIRP
jgi:predicted nuclease of predicted toxin-antitoxin system